MKIKIIKFNENLIKPVRKNYNDAGLDCYALENYTLFPMSGKEVVLGPEQNYQYMNNTCIIPLGFGLEIPDGYMAKICPRSSLNAEGVACLEGIIDSGYRGEIKAALCNLTSNPINIKKGERICQIVIEPIILADLQFELKNTRGSGGFGSTGK